MVTDIVGYLRMECYRIVTFRIASAWWSVIQSTKDYGERGGDDETDGSCGDGNKDGCSDDGDEVGGVLEMEIL